MVQYSNVFIHSTLFYRIYFKKVSVSSVSLGMMESRELKTFAKF